MSACANNNDSQKNFSINNKKKYIYIYIYIYILIYRRGMKFERPKHVQTPGTCPFLRTSQALAGGAPLTARRRPARCSCSGCART